MAEANQKPCANCRRRKVRCDKQVPCANCVRSSARCVYEDQSDGEAIAPLVLDKPTTVYLFDRLSGLEQMVRRLSDVQLGSDGHIVNVKGHLMRPSSTAVSCSGEAIKFPLTRGQPLQALSEKSFPSLEESDMLIQFFLELIEPFTRLVHVPFFHKQLTEYRAGENPLYFEAMLHCLHALALATLSSDFVLDFFRGPRDKLLAIVRKKAEEALMKVDFMRSHQPMVLRGLLYFINFLFEVGDNEYASSLVGVALRAAFRIGLHHDSMENSAFVRDARRRLWLHLQYLDRRAAILLGVESTMKLEWDTRRPKNAFDDMWEDFRTVREGFNGEPPTIIGYSDMSFVLARADIENLQDQIRLSSMKFEQMEDYINQRQKEVWKQYLINSESKSLQKFIVALLEIHVGAVYLTARQAHHKEANDDFREQTFIAGIELLEQISSIEAEMEYVQYIWVLRSFIPIQAIVTVLTCTLFRSTPDCEARAWQQIYRVYARYDNVDCRLVSSSIFEPVNSLREQALEVRREREMQR